MTLILLSPASLAAMRMIAWVVTLLLATAIWYSFELMSSLDLSSKQTARLSAAGVVIALIIVANAIIEAFL